MLSPKEIDKIAELSRIELTQDEKEIYSKQISVIFDYVDMLKEVDTEGVMETCQVTGLEDVFRVDEVKECDPEVVKKLIEQFPDKVGDLLKVKQVFS